MVPIIQFKNITKQFEGTIALDNISFSIEKGEIHCLCGENGAGKSTLINLCGGVIEPSKGSILVHGKEEKINSVSKSEKLGISIVHQEVPLCLNMTVAQNIFLGMSVAKKGIFMNEEFINSETQKILDAFKLHISPADILGNLSIAEQSLIQIAKALYKEPEILILDEPTAALTNDQREIMFQIIHKLVKKKQTTVLYVSHRLEEVIELGDRLTVFKDGRFVATKNVKDVTTEEIISMMVGRKIDKNEWIQSYATDKVLMEVKNLSKKRHFQNVSFQLKKGEILGLAGFVGAGRTEVLSSIFGVEKADEGEIYINGQKVEIKSPRDAIKQHISMIPENRRDDGLVTTMSIKDNAQLTLLSKISSKGFLNKNKSNEIMKKMIEEYSIKIGKPEDLILTLSGGNQQKAIIAKWIENDPKILLCDEPTRGIDVGAKSDIYKVLRNIASKGIGIVMVSSELPELLSLCDRIIVMHEGKITGELHKNEFTEELVMKYAAAV